MLLIAELPPFLINRWSKFFYWTNSEGKPQRLTTFSGANRHFYPRTPEAIPCIQRQRWSMHCEAFYFLISAVWVIFIKSHRLQIMYTAETVLNYLQPGKCVFGSIQWSYSDRCKGLAIFDCFRCAKVWLMAITWTYTASCLRCSILNMLGSISESDCPQDSSGEYWNWHRLCCNEMFTIVYVSTAVHPAWFGIFVKCTRGNFSHGLDSHGHQIFWV
jgi:hypothetical protein